MKKNFIDYKSFVKEVTADIRKSNRENLRAACIFARDNIKDVIETRKKSVPGAPPGKFSGQLYKSITYQVKDNEGLVGSNHFVAPLLELGTEKMKPRPYFVVTLEKITPYLKEILARRQGLW